MSRALFIPFLILLLVGFASPGLATNTPTIELEKIVHFLSTGGEDVVVEPGTYEVEAADEWLRLILNMAIQPMRFSWMPKWENMRK